MKQYDANLHEHLEHMLFCYAANLRWKVFFMRPIRVTRSIIQANTAEKMPPDLCEIFENFKLLTSTDNYCCIYVS